MKQRKKLVPFRLSQKCIERLQIAKKKTGRPMARLVEDAILESVPRFRNRVRKAVIQSV